MRMDSEGSRRSGARCGVALGWLSLAALSCSVLADLEGLKGDAKDAGTSSGGADAALTDGAWPDAPADDGASSDAAANDAALDAPVQDATPDAPALDAADDAPTTSKYAQAVMADAPALYWRLGEKVGPVAVDVSGNGRHGSFVGAIVFEKAGAVGGGETGVELAGGHITAGDVLDFAGTASFTFEIWLKWNGDPINYTRLVSKEASGAIRDGWTVLLQDGSSPTLTFERWRDSKTSALNVTKLPATTTFSHIVASYDGVTMRLYVDSVLQGTLTSAYSLIDTSAPLVVGAHSVLSNKLKGVIDEVAIYDKPLPESRILAHFSAAQGP